MLDVDLIAEKVIIQLQEDYDPKRDSDLVELCVDRAINSYKTYRNYPSNCSSKHINDDLESHIYCLVDLALFWFEKQGAGFETSHIENGVHRSWFSENEIFVKNGVFPYAKFIS